MAFLTLVSEVKDLGGRAAFGNCLSSLCWKGMNYYFMGLLGNVYDSTPNYGYTCKMQVALSFKGIPQAQFHRDAHRLHLISIPCIASLVHMDDNTQRMHRKKVK